MSESVQANATIQVSDPQVITAPLNMPVLLSKLLQAEGVPTGAQLAAMQNQLAALDARVTALEAAAQTASSGGAA